jgi:diguanylate cyclase
LSQVFHTVDATTRRPAEDPVQKCLWRGEVTGFGHPVALIRPDGQELAIDNSAAPIRDRDGRVLGAVMVFRDVTEQRRLMQQVSYQATHDALTGLVQPARI